MNGRDSFKPSDMDHWDIKIIASDNGLSPVQHQAIIWTYLEILLIRSWVTYLKKFLFEIHFKFSIKEMHFKMSSVKWGPFFSASMCYIYNGSGHETAAVLLPGYAINW